MQEKLNRYEKYYLSGVWEQELWQPGNKKIFPYLWIIGVGVYNITGRPFRVFQCSVLEMIERMHIKM